jgi:hypothetical protein
VRTIEGLAVRGSGTASARERGLLEGVGVHSRRMSVQWQRISERYQPVAERHWEECAREFGLDCPLEVFTQLFHEHHADADFAELYRAVDWGRVEWREEALSGVQWRQVSVDRGYQHAVDEARWRTLEEGVVDERDAVVAHWDEAGTWILPPVIVTGEVTGSLLRYECLVGFTRLGNLLGLLDRGEVKDVARHKAWVGRLVQQ